MNFLKYLLMLLMKNNLKLNNMTNSVIFANLTEEELETLFMSKDDIICKVFQKLNEKERKEVVKELIKRSKKEVKLQQIEQNRQQKKITNAYKKLLI